MRWIALLFATARMALVSPGVLGQTDSIAHQFGTTITAAELRAHLQVLASDSFLGRDTGKEGQKMAAAYLKAEFQRMGIPSLDEKRWPGARDGYYQPYGLIETHRGHTRLRSRGGQLEMPRDYFYLSEELQRDLAITTVIVADGDATSAPGTATGAAVVLRLNTTKNVSEGMAHARSRLDQLRSAGAAVAFVVLGPEMFESIGSLAHFGGTSMKLANDGGEVEPRKQGMQSFFMSEAGLEKLLGKRGAIRLRRARNGARVEADIKVSASPNENRLEAENVLAYIEGTGKPDELVVITAHYDHIGVENGVVYNGADDDGSGTVALLEIAQAFARAKAEGRGPQRSILIMPVSGEEKGLLGSRHYSDHPVFPLELTVANLNIDMIGRTDSAHADQHDYVYIIGSDRLSTELHAVNEEANAEHVGLELDYTFNAADDPNRFYYRSDHYNFARKGVPCIFYFSGVHEDYHQPGDDVEKIRFDLLERRARLVFHTAWLLANRPNRIRVDRPSR